MSPSSKGVALDLTKFNRVIVRALFALVDPYSRLALSYLSIYSKRLIGRLEVSTTNVHAQDGTDFLFECTADPRH